MTQVAILSLAEDGIDPEESPIISFLEMDDTTIKRAFVLEDFSHDDMIKVIVSLCVFEEKDPKLLQAEVDKLLMSIKDSGNYVETDPMLIKTKGLYDRMEEFLDQ
jgi:hypothetical protein